MTGPSELPTVELVEGAYYWVKPSYGEKAELWAVARWEAGSFWRLSGSEVSPKVICGPIPRPPAESSASSPSVASAQVAALDEQSDPHSAGKSGP